MSKAIVVVAVIILAVLGFIVFTRPNNTPTPQPKADQPLAETQTMNSKQYNAPPPMTIDQKKSYTAILTTDKGAMTVKLFASETPVTVNNFVFLSREGFYTNTIFHRIIKGFMIQGGDPQGTGMGGPGYKFADEKITRDFTRGTIAMANSGPDTNGSQFFIMHKDYALPKNYVIFGAIDPADSVSLNTLDAIAGEPVVDNGQGETSKPVTPTVIQSMSIKEE
jgi:cyclophilin family peptidyl-prolyl cis-trans isomerase